MRIYSGLDEINGFKNAVVTTGTFDGVHKGHQKILQRLSTLAHKIGGETVIITLWPHPRLVLNPDFDLKLLTTIDEKAILLEQFDIDHLIRIPFTEEFSNLSYEEYIKNILVSKIGTRKLVIGHDHRFGKDRLGKFDDLIKYGSQLGFQVVEIPKQVIDDIGISSTRIRQALLEGDILTGNEYLGRPYSISGTVVKGDGLGRKIGFSTANVSINSPHKLIPGDGSYAVRIQIGEENQQFSGMMNIGVRPTVDGKNRQLEVNIFDFEQDIYGFEITISFVKLIRREEKFSTVDELKTQLHKDKTHALSILSNVN